MQKFTKMLAIQGNQPSLCSPLDSFYGRLLTFALYAILLFRYRPRILSFLFFFLRGVTQNSMYYSRGVGQNSTNSYQGGGGGGEKNPIFTRTYYLDVPYPFLYFIVIGKWQQKLALTYPLISLEFI